MMPGSNSRSHWRVRHKAARHDRYVAQSLALVEMRKHAPNWDPITKATVSVQWRGRGCLPDVDNIGGRTKAYLDGLTDARLWSDDRAVTTIAFSVDRVRKPEQPSVVLLVTEVVDEL